MNKSTHVKIRSLHFTKNAVDPSKLRLESRLQDYIDSFLISFGTCTVIAMKGSAGKPAALVNSGINAAATGLLDVSTTGCNAWSWLLMRSRTDV